MTRAGQDELATETVWNPCNFLTPPGTNPYLSLRGLPPTGTQETRAVPMAYKKTALSPNSKITESFSKVLQVPWKASTPYYFPPAPISSISGDLFLNH